jgi:hypothetical protein
MKTFLLALLLVCNTAYAERWVQAGPLHYVDIDYMLDPKNSNIRIYNTKDLNYNLRSVVAIDCKLNLFAVYESYYFSNNKWYSAPKETLGTWHPSSRDFIHNLICR